MGVDQAGFSSSMRATFTERATGALGDVRSTLSALAQRLGRHLTSEQLDELVRLRYEHTRQSVTPRAGALEMIQMLQDAGYKTDVLTDCTAEVVDLWPKVPNVAVIDAGHVLLPGGAEEAQSRRLPRHRQEVRCRS